MSRFRAVAAMVLQRLPRDRVKARPYSIKAIAGSELPLRTPDRFASVARTTSDTVRAAIRTEASEYIRELTRPMRSLVVAALTAHALKPYGPGSLADLGSMLAAPTLDCSNFGLLTLQVVRMIDAECLETLHVRFIGWESKAIGNHQMLLAVEKTSQVVNEVVLDPTVGVVAKAGFDTFASQRPVGARSILAFAQQAELKAAQAQMVEALIGGRLKPSEILYFFESEAYLLHHYGAPEIWPTPGAVTWRNK